MRTINTYQDVKTPRDTRFSDFWIYFYVYIVFLFVFSTHTTILLFYLLHAFPHPLFLSIISRPNSFVIITAHRVLHCNAETPEEMHHWIALLQRSKGDTRVQGQEFIIRGETLRHQVMHRSVILTIGHTWKHFCLWHLETVFNLLIVQS